MIFDAHILVGDEEEMPKLVNDISLQEVSLGSYKILENDIWYNFRDLEYPLSSLETQQHYSNGDETKCHYYIFKEINNHAIDVSVLY